MQKRIFLLVVSVFSMNSLAETAAPDPAPLFEDYTYTAANGVRYTERRINASDVGFGVVKFKMLKLENEKYRYDYSEQSDEVKTYNNTMCENMGALPPIKSRVFIVGKYTVPFNCEPKRMKKKQVQI